MYENFGFKENIFNTKPLNLCSEDLEKFIGRVQDIKNFLKKEVKGNVANYKITGVIHLAKYAGMDI